MAADSTPSVFLVDDHALIRSGIRAEIAASVELVGEADEVDAAIELICERRPDVVLLALKVAFRATMSVGEVEDVTNRIEAAIRDAMPQMQKIFIEADSRGDMRGVASPA